MERGGYRGGRGGYGGRNGGGGGRRGGYGGGRDGGRGGGYDGGRGSYSSGHDGGRSGGVYQRPQWRPNNQGGGVNRSDWHGGGAPPSQNVGGAGSTGNWHGGRGGGSQREWRGGAPFRSGSEVGHGHSGGGRGQGGRNDQVSESKSKKELVSTGSANVGSSSTSGGSYHNSPRPYVSHSSMQKGLPSSSSAKDPNRIVPIQRPDGGGTMAVRTPRLLANHFPVKFNHNSIILHYDVDVKPEVLQKHGRPVKITKSNLAMIRDKLFADDPSRFPLGMTAYDGEKNIFSAVPLPAGTFKVDVSEGEDMRPRSYLFTIKLVNELELCKLKDYLSGQLLSIPRDILQGMDVVVKEQPSRRMISVGRSFHSVEAHQHDLEPGIIASKGIQHSLKPTSQGLALSLDYSVLSFYKRLPVIEFLKERIPGFNLNNFREFRRDVLSLLKGLKVTVTHRVTRQKYVITGLTNQNTKNITFPQEDPDGNASREVRLVDYFREKYHRDIMFLDIPCLDMKSNTKNYVPMEFCVLFEGQIYPKEHLGKNSTMLLKDISLAKAHDRQRAICSLVEDGDGPCGGDVIQNFGMEVSMHMTPVVGRVIGPPELKVGAPNGRPIKITVDKEKCQWNLVGKGVVEGKPIERWAVLDFSSDESNRYFRFNPDLFIPKLIARCRTLGIQMGEPFYETSSMRIFSNVDLLRERLERMNGQAQKIYGGRLQILLCVMSRKDPGYKNLKWISETKIGIVTQCCLSTPANKGNDQYLANLGLKINAKLGGSNAELGDRLPYFGDENNVMFIGADVNHPGARNTTCPSIAAVVGTINWPAANRYAARVRPQDHRSERILRFGEMCLELVECYSRLNKVKPEKIVIFRDGVSEGQFDMVLNEELIDIKKAFQSMNYTPTITLIVAQKRHLTRLFQANGGSYSNVSPGTVVDTTIVHPFEYDFYLCSHYGGLGTSKPTHYYVLWDEHGLGSDQFQKLIYNMCFTFARCTKPVSLAPPVYYADLVAYRGRLYHEAVMEGQSPSSVSSFSSSRTSSSSLSVAAPLEERFCQLHADLENIMFFV